MKTNKINFLTKILMVLFIGLVIAPFAAFAAEAAAGATTPATATTSLWTALIPLIVPIVVAGLKLLVPKIPVVWLPILCPVVGMAVDLIAYFAGQQTQGTAMGALLGLAGTGVREIYDQLKKQLSGSAVSAIAILCLLGGVAVGCSNSDKKNDKDSIAPTGDAPCQVTPAHSTK